MFEKELFFYELRFMLFDGYVTAQSLFSKQEIVNKSCNKTDYVRHHNTKDKAIHETLIATLFHHFLHPKQNTKLVKPSQKLTRIQKKTLTLLQALYFRLVILQCFLG